VTPAAACGALPARGAAASRRRGSSQRLLVLALGASFEQHPGMRSFLPLCLLTLASPLLAACGGTTEDPGLGEATPGPGAASGSSGAAGSSAGSGGTGGASGAGAAGGSGGGGPAGAGGAGSGGAGGSAGAAGAGGSGGAAAQGQGGSSGQGGSGGEAGAAGQGGAGQGGAGQGGAGQGGSAGGADITGSYTLTFTSVDQSKSPFGNLTSPSPTTPARLDIRKNGEAYDAAFFARFSPVRPDPLTVTLSGESVLLEGIAHVQGTSDGATVSDGWSALTLARSPDGSLAGTLSATGIETVLFGDSLGSTGISGTGTLSADTLPPELEADFSSAHGPTDALLPWDPLTVSLSEAIAPDLLLPHLSVALFGPETPLPLPVTWSFKPTADEPAAWAGAVAASGFLESWDLPASGSVALQISAGAADPSGNTAPALVAETKVLPVGQPTKAFPFDSDVVTEAHFGMSALLGGFAGSDAHCEKGGCVRLGPFEQGGCKAGGNGIAGRLAAKPGDTLSIRYRFAIAGAQGGPAPQVFGAIFGVDLHGKKGVVSALDSEFGATTLHALPVVEDDLTWSSDWLTATRTVTGVEGDDIGFVLYTGSSFSVCSSILPPPVKMALFIDSITVE
jgi:hypothetical protein